MGRNGVHGIPWMKAHLLSWWDQASSLPPPAGPAHPLGWMCLADVRETHRHNSSQEGDVACLGDNLDTGQEVQCPHHDQCSCVPQCGRCGGH